MTASVTTMAKPFVRKDLVEGLRKTVRERIERGEMVGH